MINPVIPGFHPDPSICRVGDDYYLACSSFEYFPGVPIFHSRDLVRWRQIGNVLDRPGQLDLPADVPASGGIWAPTLRHHDGQFWLITKDVSGAGNFIVTAERADGPWSDPVPIDLPGIDPDLAWDDEHNCYCTFSGLQQAVIDPKRGKILEGPWPVWSGTGLAWPEGPHLHRRGDWWYLLMSEGGTHTGHAISVARSRSPRGPFEPAPRNPILSHRSTDRPVQALGHADLVETPGGDWWMVLLGTRPKGRFPRQHVLGRETFLAPLTWVDDWPVVASVEAYEQPLLEESDRDDFDAAELSPRWISPRSRPPWSLTERPGWLTLHATGPTLDRPGATILARRQQHHDVRVTARLDPRDGRGGLTIRIDEAHHYDVEAGAGEVRAVCRIGPLRDTVARIPVPPGPVDLVIATRTTGILPPTVTARTDLTEEPYGVAAAAPDTITLGTATTVLAELDGRYLSTEVATGFTGRVIGLYATEGTVSADWFDYRPAG